VKAAYAPTTVVRMCTVFHREQAAVSPDEKIGGQPRPVTGWCELRCTTLPSQDAHPAPRDAQNDRQPCVWVERAISAANAIFPNPALGFDHEVSMQLVTLKLRELGERGIATNEPLSRLRREDVSTAERDVVVITRLEQAPP